jgi:ubiquinone/menaquinone biosynthesis C-methylase UbiE
MGELLNLTSANVKLYDGPPRNMDPTFGFDYFDNTRDTGYGGYHYDGRWKPVAKTILEKYNLKSGDRILDLGCGKGFLLADLIEECPGLEAKGIEISEYAIENAHPPAKQHMSLGSIEKLPFPDDYFDAVMAINVFHFLSPEKTEIAFKEMLRVGKESKNYFVHVDAFTNEVERERLLAWAPIIKTVYSCDDWFNLFKKLGYEGDYYWTFVRPETPENFPAP